MPYHVDLDGAYEELLGKNNIGTTKRGIGPCYQDKMARIGIRMQDLMDEATFREKLEIALARVNPQLERIFDMPAYTVDQICETYLPMAERLRPYICETGLLLNNLVEEGKEILFEGAPGDAARHRPWHLPVRDLFQLHRRRRRDRFWCGHEEHRPRSGHHEGLHHARGLRPHADRARL